MRKPGMMYAALVIAQLSGTRDGLVGAPLVVALVSTMLMAIWGDDRHEGRPQGRPYRRLGYAAMMSRLPPNTSPPNAPQTQRAESKLSARRNPLLRGSDYARSLMLIL